MTRLLRNIFRWGSRLQTKLAKKAGVLVVVLALPLVLSACASPEQPPILLTWWNVFDDPLAYRDIIKSYEENNNIKIELTTFTYAEYEQELVRSIASGTGPDIFTIQNSWLPEHRDLIAPQPQIQDFVDATQDELDAIQPRLDALVGLREYVDSYVPVVAQDFVSEDRIFAIPLYVDSLALFYNKDLLNSANRSVPTTWTDFADTAEVLTTRDANGRITRSGAALGASSNINRSIDILTTMMIQSGATPVDASRQFASFAEEIAPPNGNTYNPGFDALEFYTDFAIDTSDHFTWSLDPETWYSIENFASGEVAMMINYSHQVEAVRNKNAKLNFGIARLPTLEGARFYETYANYWGHTVSKSSPAVVEAWEFLNYLGRDDNNLTYLQNAQKPPAKLSQVPAFENDLDLGVFADQAAVAKSFYTPDAGLTETVLAQAIEDVILNRRSVEQALQVAASQITQQLQSREYPPTGI
ncbi:MAG: extracellular solute-binding protein [bacterium]|nr:extracellular solute-binding protein [bacterium]